jgi:hypothetical protein
MLMSVMSLQAVYYVISVVIIQSACSLISNTGFAYLCVIRTPEHEFT